MTAAMFDEMYANTGDEAQPTALRPGTLVYLWRPGETPWAAGSRPVLARVEVGRAHCIVAIDLADGARGIYEITGETPGHLWSWEQAARPQSPCMGSEVEILDAMPTVEEHTRFLAGEPGERLQVRLDSGEVLWGHLQRVVMGPDPVRPEMIELVDPVPGEDARIHVLKVKNVAAVTRFRRA